MVERERLWCGRPAGREKIKNGKRKEKKEKNRRVKMSFEALVNTVMHWI